MMNIEMTTKNGKNSYHFENRNTEYTVIQNKESFDVWRQHWNGHGMTLECFWKTSKGLVTNEGKKPSKMLMEVFSFIEAFELRTTREEMT